MAQARNPPCALACKEDRQLFPISFSYVAELTCHVAALCEGTRGQPPPSESEPQRTLIDLELHSNLRRSSSRGCLRI